MTTVAPAPGIPPELRIRAVRARHPWRTVAAIVLLLAVLSFVLDASGREAYDWAAFRTYIFDQRIVQAAGVTIQLTVYAMIGAIVLGVALAVMRQSPNKILAAISWAFIWVFRGTPVYVQLVFWGLFTTIYKTIDVGLPLQDPWFSVGTGDLLSLFWIAVLGLALNEAAYMAEIVRAGLLAVDPGQDEAATALGMSWGQMMRKVILPQAMRVIIPPTGNEVISMLKTTSLVTAVPFSLDLYTRSRDISSETLNPIPLLLVASVWYLTITSVLMVGQYFLERRFSRGQVRRVSRSARGEGSSDGVTKTISVVPAFGTDTGDDTAQKGATL
ncbi:amino acid ABC transporter permease [Leucobacter luti]|uniref:amino acid ABC transporter permease n=1 Tax=Leucobacter luti TaxID=340320 RepID=UPI001C68B112|nr:amino acid ABC transporter permease [Leucobacter luti]QYM75439.1 amino acid ABC transporter permease [Leucobacter luti]